jgi:hypothetical protein
MSEPLVSFKIETGTVISAEATTHEEHPESYSPRIFFTTVQQENGTVTHVRHYELLQTGYALKWKTLPIDKFEFMHFTLQNLSGFNKMKVLPERVTTYWTGTTVPTDERLGQYIPTLENTR